MGVEFAFDRDMMLIREDQTPAKPRTEKNPNAMYPEAVMALDPSEVPAV